MRALLDTNILIHREAATVTNPEIGVLFYWLDKQNIDKCIHPKSIEEIRKHKDKNVRKSFEFKLKSYIQLGAIPKLDPRLSSISNRLDNSENDRVDSALLNILLLGQVDILITEDKRLTQKARLLGIDQNVYTIERFLERSAADNPSLVDYRSVTVRKEYFSNIDITSRFFDSFRADYPGFNEWFSRKGQELAYICEKDANLVAFLYLKVEDHYEAYGDISPSFAPKRRLKIGTFKVELYGLRLGERFLKIAFDNAISQKVDEIYVTVFEQDPQRRLINLIEEYGFQRYGTKASADGRHEAVLVRDMWPRVDQANPTATYPYFALRAPAYLVPIYPKYHTSLLPDSILNTESPDDFRELEPHRNAIRKSYISRSHFRALERGDVIVFYRTGGYHRGVASSVGVVEDARNDIRDEAHFIEICRNRTVFSREELRQQWNWKPNNRPFVVDFLFCYSLPTRPNLKRLIDNGVIKDPTSAPRGFERISASQFKRLLELASVNPRIVVD
jgi:predicted nucleic acid-binding protein